MKTFSDREGNYAKTSLDKEEMLMRRSVPPNAVDQYNILPPAGIANTCVTDQAVERALFSQSVTKARRLGKLPFGGTPRPSTWENDRIVRLTKAAIRTGVFPGVWKRARSVGIRKHGN